MWGYIVIFRSLKGPARTNVGKHCCEFPTIGADATATRDEEYLWRQGNCNGLNKTFNKASRRLHWHRSPKFSKYYIEDFLGQGWRNYDIYDISRLRVKDLHSATYIYVVRRLRVKVMSNTVSITLRLVNNSLYRVLLCFVLPSFAAWIFNLGDLKANN